MPQVDRGTHTARELFCSWIECSRCSINWTHGFAAGARLPAREGRAVDAYRGQLWVTRPRPGVDRMASAWLIQRFIDPDAQFGFVPDRDTAPRDAVPFDMFGVEVSHHGEHCTFETLIKTFGLDDAAVTRIASIVHDLDLKDARFGRPDAPAVGVVIDGLQRSYAKDDQLLTQGIVLFEALYRAFDQADRRPGPTPVAGHRQRKGRPPRR